MNYQIVPGLKRNANCKVPTLYYSSKQDLIILAIEDYFKIKFSDLKRKTRKRNIVYPRQLCMYLLCIHTKLSLKYIGELFGGRDHTTVIHSRELIMDLLQCDTRVKDDLDKISESF
jgi:chromosomal replication initiator protein